MMDQLASIGVEFDEMTIERLYGELERYYLNSKDGSLPTSSDKPHKLHKPKQHEPLDHSPQIKSLKQFPQVELPDHPSQTTSPSPSIFSFLGRTALNWAIEPVFGHNTPIRPWGLGQTFAAKDFFYKLIGQITRTPGLYHKVDSSTGKPTNMWLEDSNERVHSSVRVRLALQGLGLDDQDVWDCKALSKKWQLKKTTTQFEDPVPRGVDGWAGESDDSSHSSDGSRTTLSEERWVWEYIGPENDAPPPRQRIMVEDPLGPYERQFLKLAAGSPNVYEFAASRD